MRGVLLRSILAGAVLLSQTWALEAGCNFYPSTSYSYAPTYYAPPVVKVQKVVAVEYLAVPVVAPVYAIGYAAPAAVVAAAPAAPAAPTSPCSEEVKSLRAELEKLKAALAGGAPPAPPPQPQNAPAGKKSVFALRCAGCHDASVAKTKGGKLEMFQNGVALPLSAELANECVRQVLSRHMPKGNVELTNEDLNAILDEVLQLSAPKK